MEPPNPSGYCQCGCGEKTPIARQGSTRSGHVAGEHVSFIHGHHWRGRKRAKETTQKMSAAQKKRWAAMTPEERKMGPMPEWWKEKISAGQPKRENHWNWKGGRYVDGDGYVVVTLPREHPMARSDGRAREHRLVMAEHLGRPLLSTEDVHHINGDKTDNRIENLEVVDHNLHQWNRHQRVYQTAVRSLLATGLSVDEVAEELHLTPEAVKRHAG